MDAPKRSLKNLFLIGLGASSLILLLSAFSFNPQTWKEDLNKNVEAQAKTQLEALFGREVKIEKISGLIVGEIILNNVQIATEKKLSTAGAMATAQKVIINFNPIEYVYKKGDILPAIYKLTVIGGNANVVRDRKGNWNVLGLLPKPDPASKNQSPLPFNGKIIIKETAATFTDYCGWTATHPAKPFQADLKNLGGEIELKKNTVNLNLSGDVVRREKLVPVIIKGNYNLKNNKYKFDLRADNLDLKDWESYILEIPHFRIKEGLANVEKLSISGPETKAPYFKVDANIVLKDAQAQILEYEIKSGNGLIKLKEDEVALVDFSANYKDAKAVANGRIYNFANPYLELSGLSPNCNLLYAKDFVKGLGEIDFSGSGQVALRANGPLTSPDLVAQIISPQATLYGKPLGGSVEIALKGSVVTITMEKLSLYGGVVQGPLEIDFSQKNTYLKAALNLKNIDLAALANQTPGIEGKADGSLNLSGSLNNLKVNTNLSLKQAWLYGQAVQKGQARFIYRNGNIQVEEFKVFSEKGQLTAKGNISKDLVFDLSAQSRGLVLTGQGFLGPMRAGIKNFEGKLNFTLNEIFLKNPLKNLNAEGKVEIENANLGRQVIEQASGTIAIGDGQISIWDGILKTGETIITVEGQTGIGIETSLAASGKNCQLEKLQIFSYFIPLQTYAKIKGLCDIDINISGTIPKSSRFDSFSPLLLLNTSMDLKISQARMEEVSLAPSVLRVEYANKTLTIKELKLFTTESSLYLSGSLDEDLNLDFNYTANLALKDLLPLLPPEEVLAGKGKFEGHLKGSLDDPSIDCSFSAQKIKWNIFNLANLTGKLRWQNDRLMLVQALRTESEKDHYSLSGSIDFSNTQNLSQLENTVFALELDIDDSDLNNFLNLAELIRVELQTRLALAQNLPSVKAKINTKDLSFPLPTKFIKNGQLSLYKSNGPNKGKYFLDIFGEETETVITPRKKLQVSAIKNVGGTLSGQLKLSGSADHPIGAADLTVKDGYIQTFHFEELNCQINLENQAVSFEKFALKKGGGSLSLDGDFTFNSTLSLEVKAKNLPVDILNVLFPEETNLEGNFNLTGAVRGNFKHPELDFAFNSQRINLTGAEFDRTEGKIEVADDLLRINNLKLEKSGRKSSINGQIPLGTKGAFNLAMTLEGQALSLVNILTNNINYDSGDCKLFLLITGPASKPDLEGQATITNTTIRLPSLGQDTRVENIDCSLTLEKGLLKIANCSGRWKGKNTKNEPNQITLSGSLDLNPLFTNDKEITLNLNLKDTDLVFEWVGLYSGEILVNNASISGPLPLSDAALKKRGPTVKGTLTLNEGNIFLPQGNIRKNKDFYLNYDLILNIVKEVTVSAGDPAAIDLRNILLNLEAKGNDLEITGNSEEPHIRGTVTFGEGKLSILGRDFDLLIPSAQEKYYPYERDKIKANTAVFKELEGAEGVIPELDLTALAEVIDYSKVPASESGDTNNTNNTTLQGYEKEKVLIVSRITGMPFVKEEGRGIKIGFASFKEDTSQKPAVITPVKYTDQEIKTLLLPDFLKGPLGLSNRNLPPEEAASILDNYINNYLRARFVRNVERNLETSLGLESLTLEYNFGKALRKNITGSSSTSRRESARFGVGMVKNLFDRFYVAAKYSQAMGAEELAQQAAQNFNYELIYKLSGNWSLSYYQEPLTMTNLTVGYYKLTLQGGYYF